MRVLALSLIALAGCATIESPAADETTEAPAPARPIAMAMHLKPGDVVEVRAPGAPELSGVFALDEDSVLQIGDTVWVPGYGQTLGQLADTIAAVADVNGVARSGPVEVWLQTDGVFYVLGEVNAPGAFAYRPGISLNDAIASAGGASARAEPGWADHESEGADGPIRRSLAGEPVTVAPGDVVRVRAAEG